jgi:hypothetical protein
MQRIDLFGFYRLGEYVHPATELRKPPLTISVIGAADIFLRILVEPPHEPLPLKLSIASALELLEKHSDLGQRYGSRILGSAESKPGEDVFFNAAMEGAERAARDFEAVLEKELLATHAYFVSPKGAYDTSILLERAEAAITESFLHLLPEHAIQDFREAGRCLALEVPTASGYHATRSVEAVLRHWHHLLIKDSAAGEEGKPNSAALRWARLEADLVKHGAPKSTVGILTQIRELHRNPIMHPEIFLSIGEAMSLFDISKSARGYGARDRKDF